MSWSTELFCNISFNRETFNNIHEVENKIEEIKAQKDMCCKELRDLAIMTEPAKYMESDSERTPYDFVCQQFESNMELFQELTVELFKLELLLQNWDKSHTKDGLAIDPPNNIEWDSAFLSGDFVRSLDNPDIQQYI